MIKMYTCGVSVLSVNKKLTRFMIKSIEKNDSYQFSKVFTVLDNDILCYQV